MPQASEEAYFIGLLIGRGSLEYSTIHFAQGTPYGKYVLRIPSYKYTLLGKAIIETLIDHPNGLDSQDIIDNSPKLKSKLSLTPKVVGIFCGRTLQKWHPISLGVSKSLLFRAGKKWVINDKTLAKRYLEEQEKYFERNRRSLDFVLNYIQETLKHFSVNISILPPELGPFNMEYFSIECHMPPVSFEMLNNKYGLSLGDAYKHLTLPTAIESFSIEEKREFIRGLADSTAHFDEGPPWYGNGKKGLWQVRLTLLADSRPELAVQICRLLQEDIGLPVLSINYIKGDMPAKMDYRGGRERHIIIWVANIRKHFPARFFRNDWKEEELEKNWQEDKGVLKQLVGQKRRSIKSMLSTCPRTSEQPPYASACLAHGCIRQKQKANSSKLRQFSGK